MTRFGAMLAVALGLCAVSACGSNNTELVGTGTGGSSANAGVGGASGGAGVSGMGAGSGTCQGHVYECGDGIDNDGDGKIDSVDPDCLGPCDNTESNYYGGIPGQNNAPCKMDCYFDQDTGPGNDDCYWNHECDPLAVAPAYPPEGFDQSNKPYCQYNANANTPGTNKTCAELSAQQSALCASYCGPLTPNGCDCFGCCELPAGGGKYVWLGSTVNGAGSCDIASLADPTRCEPCTPVSACLNGCGHCEICIGKDTIPSDCTPDAGSDGGEQPQCPAGVAPCGRLGQSACGFGYYCITGCCVAVPH